VVATSIDDAFEVFTDEIDTWWPRTHHIGKAPMRRVIVEGRAGGRCYTEQVDGTEADWGRVLDWDPPHRLRLAWQITHLWGYQPDLAKASEVEVRFTSIHAESTRVEVEHRFFERHGEGGAAMRTAVNAPNGWTGIMTLFADRVSARTKPAPGTAV
jgi:uncharacterized protein YndB with AHSA1/START domain